MKKIILITLIIIIALASIASAIEIRFENTTNRTLIYRLYWLAADIPGLPKIINMAAGELGAGKRQSLNNDYKPGPYAITWESLPSSNDSFYIVHEFTVEEGKYVLISTPEMTPVRMPTY